MTRLENQEISHEKEAQIVSLKDDITKMLDAVAESENIRLKLAE